MVNVVSLSHRKKIAFVVLEVVPSNAISGGDGKNSLKSSKTLKNNHPGKLLQDTSLNSSCRTKDSIKPTSLFTPCYTTFPVPSQRLRNLIYSVISPDVQKLFLKCCDYCYYGCFYVLPYFFDMKGSLGTKGVLANSYSMRANPENKGECFCTRVCEENSLWLRFVLLTG